MSPQKAAMDAIERLTVWCEAQTPEREFNERQRQSFNSLLHEVIGAILLVHVVREQVSGRGDGHAKGADATPAHARHFSPRPEAVVAPCRCGHAPGRHWPGWHCDECDDDLLDYPGAEA